MRMSLSLSPKWLPSRGEIKRERTNLVAKVCTSSFTCDRPLLAESSRSELNNLAKLNDRFR
jgi:hypothetical protein